MVSSLREQDISSSNVVIAYAPYRSPVADS